MKIERVGDITILNYEGDLDAFSLPAVAEEVDTLVKGGDRKLVFNCSKVSFIGSAALGYLLSISKELKDLGGEHVVSEPSAFLRSTIVALGVEQVFKVFPTNDEAVAYFGAAGS